MLEELRDCCVCRFFPKIKDFHLFLIFSLFALSISLTIEFVIGIKPCTLCLAQRWIIVLILLSSTLCLVSNFYLFYIKITRFFLFISFGVAVTQFLVQLGIVQDFCITPRAIEDIKSFKAMLQHPPIPCSSSFSRPIDLSLTFANGLGSVFLFLLSSTRSNREKKAT